MIASYLAFSSDFLEKVKNRVCSHQLAAGSRCTGWREVEAWHQIEGILQVALCPTLEAILFRKSSLPVVLPADYKASPVQPQVGGVKQ